MPTVVSPVQRPPDAKRPVALIGVSHAIDLAAFRVHQNQRVVAVAQPAPPAADHQLHARVFGTELFGVRRQHEPATGWQPDLRKIEADPPHETPAVQGHRLGVPIEQLYVFLSVIPRRRMVHDLVDNHTDKTGLDPYLPLILGEQVAVSVADAVIHHPCHVDSSACLLRELKPIRPAPDAANRVGWQSVDPQIRCVHTGHLLRELQRHFPQGGNCYAPSRDGFVDDRRHDVHIIVSPQRRRARSVEGVRRGETIGDAVFSRPRHRHRTVGRFRKSESPRVSSAGNELCRLAVEQ